MAFFFQELVNGIITGALYALVALGFSMVYGVRRHRTAQRSGP